MLTGYCRISKGEQNLDNQRDLLIAAGCEKIFEDVASGSKSERPGLANCLEYIRAGDTLVVWKLDRLGRSLKHLIEVVDDLKKRNIEFKSLTEGFDTTTMGGRLIFQIFGAIAEFERSLIIERTRIGLAAARARGRKGGRPILYPDSRIRAVQDAVARSPEKNIREICQEMGLSYRTYYRRLGEIQTKKR